MILSPFGRAGVRAIERILRWRIKVVEFDPDPRNMLRISPGFSRARRTLSDGAVLAPGDLLIDIHLWNERLPQVPAGGADVAFGVAFVHGFRDGLRSLAGFLARGDATFDRAKAIHADFGFLQADRKEQTERVLRHMGFDVFSDDAVGYNLLNADFWPNLFSWWIILTFNPGSRRGKTFRNMRRYQLWMSREMLMRIYGPDRSG